MFCGPMDEHRFVDVSENAMYWNFVVAVLAADLCPHLPCAPPRLIRAWLLAFLWAGLLAGPFAWAALLEANYVLSYVACEQRAARGCCTLDGRRPGHRRARRAWPRGAPGGRARRTRPDRSDTRVARARSMAVGGLAMCAWFALVILATEIPALVLQPCTP